MTKLDNSQHGTWCRATTYFIQTLRSRPRVWRCADSVLIYCHCWIPLSPLADPALPQRANILKEVQIMRQLDHPNIVKLVEFSEARQYYYIVLELCPGGELFHQIVRLTYFSEDLARHVIVQVAKALDYLHEEAGVVHRYGSSCASLMLHDY